MEILHDGNLCPVCEEGRLTLVKKEIEFAYKGESIHVQRDVFACSVCKEVFFQTQDERELEKLLTDTRRHIDGLLTSDEIRTIRRQFGLTQVDFATYLRVSKKTFARYETGQATQSYAMDDLLRILQKYPETMQIFTERIQPVHQLQPDPNALLGT